MCALCCIFSHSTIQYLLCILFSILFYIDVVFCILLSILLWVSVQEKTKDRKRGRKREDGRWQQKGHVGVGMIEKRRSWTRGDFGWNVFNMTSTLMFIMASIIGSTIASTITLVMGSTLASIIAPIIGSTIASIMASTLMSIVASIMAYIRRHW